MDVAMPKLEAEEFAACLGPGKVLLEFGSGGSTIHAARRKTQVFSVESDLKWISNVTLKLADEGLLSLVRIIHADIGKTKEWGHPVSRPTCALGVGYVLTPFVNLSGAELNSITDVLVDGRFRVASALASTFFLSQSFRLLVDDYGDRPNYGHLRQILGEPRMSGRMATWDVGVGREVSPERWEAIHRYSADPS